MRHTRILVLALLIAATARAATYPDPKSGDYTAHDWKFTNGESLADVHLHYTTLGEPTRDANGHVSNAVLILHGTGGSGRGFLSDTFAGVLFGPGQLLDATKYFIILPDNIGHGASSKPSDGLRMRFPHYDYDDMVALQHELLVKGLNVDHLRLVLGTSMGCMHAWVWGEAYPGFADALMPLACATVEIAGRNRMMRKGIIDLIKADPAWNDGNYSDEPKLGLRAAEEVLQIMTGSPLQTYKQAPKRDAADRLLDQRITAALGRADANDMLYQFDASRDYNPSPKLEAITAPVMAINSADDQVNPPELGIMEREIRRVRRGRFVLLPITDQTRGHGTHSLPAIWQPYLAQLLLDSGGLAAGTSTSTPSVQTPPAPIFPSVGPRANGDSIAEAPNAGAQVATLPDGSPVYMPGRGVVPPRAISAQQARYPDDALRERVQGLVLLQVIVDQEGNVTDPKVVRPLFPSVDQRALETVRTWKFQPATRDGKPVAVRLNIEVNFRMGGKPASAAPIASLPDGTPVYIAGPDLTPVRKIEGGDPQYTDYARKKKISGTVILRVVVGPDGLVHDVGVIRSLEPSLDQSAMDTIRTWRFEPATRDGKPVAVQLNVETTFHLR